MTFLEDAFFPDIESDKEREERERGIQESFTIEPGENSCPEPECKGYFIYDLGVKRCFVCGYNPFREELSK